MGKLKSYKELQTWQKSVDYGLLIYGATKIFPKEEIYGLTSQLRRAAISIASNIAEGSERGTTKEFIQFLRIASGSLAECETQLYFAHRLGYCDTAAYDALELKSREIGRMLNGLITKLNAR
ncbi:MAG: four helix bundle protein [Rickettsiales bacterium]